MAANTVEELYFEVASPEARPTKDLEINERGHIPIIDALGLAECMHMSEHERRLFFGRQTVEHYMHAMFTVHDTVSGEVAEDFQAGSMPALETPDLPHKAQLTEDTLRTVINILQSPEWDDSEALQRAALTLAVSLIYIHPFNNGNGRTSRVLAYLLEVGCSHPAIEVSADLRNIVSEDGKGYFDTTPHPKIARELDRRISERSTEDANMPRLKIEEFLAIMSSTKDVLIQTPVSLFSYSTEAKRADITHVPAGTISFFDLCVKNHEDHSSIVRKYKKRDYLKRNLPKTSFEWRRLRLDAFNVSNGILEHPDGVGFDVFERVDGDIGSKFDAHGISKLTLDKQLDALINLLDNGVDSSRTFYTAPFEISDEAKQAIGPASGTAGGTAYKDGLAVVVGGYGERIAEGGIRLVFINDAYKSLLKPLQKSYPDMRFYLLSEQKMVLESESSK